MEKEITTSIPLYYIEYYKPKTGKLMDISEEGYPTLELCLAAIEEFKIMDNVFEKELLEQYEEALKNFVLDLDSSDQEPPNPINSVQRCDMKPHLL